jgi:hypothetical protein
MKVRRFPERSSCAYSESVEPFTSMGYLQEESAWRRRQLSVFAAIVILVAACFSSSGCGAVDSLPRTEIPSTTGLPITPIMSWRIVGSFRLPDAYQHVYTSQAAETAFATDYLESIGGKEVPLRVGKSTTSEHPSFDHDPNDEPEFDAQTLHFYNQTISFPIPAVDSQVLFRKPGEFYKVMYAASRIFSESPREAFLVVTGDSPIKLWLNDKVVIISRADSVGHDPTVDYVVPIHLNGGDNTLLVKMFCFPQRNNMAISIADRPSAKAFVHEHGGLLDVLDQVIVPNGVPLTLSDNLRLYAANAANSHAKIFIANSEGRAVLSLGRDLLGHSTVPTDGIASGLYTIYIHIGDDEFAEPFFIGNKEDFASVYRERAKRDPEAGSYGYREALQGLQQEFDNHDAAFRLGHQKVAVFLMSILESSFAGPTEWKRLPELGAFSYISKVDGQQQDLVFHLPKTYDGKRPVPLVLVIPHNTPPRSKIVGRSGSDIDTMEQLSNLSDEFGFATAWLHVRGLVYDTPLALTDTTEALGAIENEYKIDTSRVYLLGDCGGGVNVLSLGEAMPDHFAAMGLVNPVTHFKSARAEDKYWENISNPMNFLMNLKYLPVQMVHFVNFPHSPFVQSQDLQEQFSRLGKHSDLIALSGNGWGIDRDPWRLSYEFFHDKSRVVSPDPVDLVAGRLGRASPYWLSLTQSSEGEAGTAHLQAESRHPVGTSIKALGVAQSKIPPAFMGRMVSPKNPSIEGPISDAFARAFVVVQGTQGSAQDQANSRTASDRVADAWRTAYGEPLRRKMDVQISSSDMEQFNLVLVGTRESNGILQKIWNYLPLTINSDRVTVGGQEVEGNDLSVVLVYPNPLNPQRYVVVITSNGESPIDMSDFNLAKSGKFDVGIWSDFAFSFAANSCLTLRAMASVSTL